MKKLKKNKLSKPEILMTVSDSEGDLSARICDSFSNSSRFSRSSSEYGTNHRSLSSFATRRRRDIAPECDELLQNDQEMNTSTTERGIRPVTFQALTNPWHVDMNKLATTISSELQYAHIWQRMYFKIRVRRAMEKLNLDVLSYGTSGDLFTFDDKYKENLEEILDKKIRHEEAFRNLDNENVQYFPRYLIHPESTRKKLWNIVLTGLLIYTATIMPYRLAFENTVYYDAWTIIDTLIDAMFFIDIIVNSFSSYNLPDGFYEISLSKIFLKYLRTWLLIDLVACIPFGLFEDASLEGERSANYNNFARLSRLPRLYKLLRLSRLVKIFKTLKNTDIFDKIQDFFQVNARIAKLIGFVITVVVCIHIMGCFWFLAARFEEFEPKTWVVRYGILDEDIGTQYISSIYWAMTTLGTIGYGDIVPGTNLERVISILWMILGVGFYSFTVGSLSSLLSSIDSRDAALTTKLYAIGEFSEETGLDKKLCYELRKAVKYHSYKIGTTWNDKMTLFNELPRSLKYSVAMTMHQNAAKNIPFFKTKDPAFVTAVIPYLKPLHISDDRFIYIEDQHADEIYFLLKGRANLVIGLSEIVYKSFLKGSYFGECEIILRTKRQDNVKSFGDCELLVMTKQVSSI